MSARTVAPAATLVYVYAVVGGEAERWSDRPTGLENTAVRVVEEGAVAAIVSDVPRDDYAQAKLDEHVRDGEWLTPRATVHQEVNAAAHRALDAVLPTPFGTIFTGDDRVREMLRTRAEELRAKLVQVRGQSEWVVALERDSERASGHLSKVGDAMKGGKAGPGRQYLQERQAEASKRTELRGLDQAAADSAHEILARVSRHSFEEPVIEGAGEVIARTTYLVRRDDEERFHDAIARFDRDWADRGYGLRATGPWPPYRTSGGAS